MLDEFVKAIGREKYSYTFTESADSVSKRITKLLNASGFLSGPNICGKLNGNKFEATHAWTLMDSRGASPIYLDGIIISTGDNSTRVDITIYPGFGFRVAPYFWIAVTCWIVFENLHPDRAPNYKDLVEKFVIAVIFIGIIFLVVALMRYMKKGLLTTFQEELQVEPDSP